MSEYNKAPFPDGLQYICRDCNREMCARRRAEIKAAVFEFYGPVCACCGESEVVFLTLDHVNNDGAEHRRTLGAKPNSTTGTDVVYRWLVKTKFAEADRFQVLCYNCNCGKRSNGGVCPHQVRRTA